MAAAIVSQQPTSPASAEQSVPPPLVISRGSEAAGTYQAFPDMCRLANGDIVAVFYAGYTHVSLPKEPDWPNGGRICLVRSKDDGRTWSAPAVIYDDGDDNRDPHISQMPDGSLLVTFFSLRADKTSASGHTGNGMKIVRSPDGGQTWDKEARTLAPAGSGWYCSAPVRVLPTGTWILGLYHYAGGPDGIYGGVLRSADSGKTWSDPIPIGKGQGIPLDAETDILPLKDGSLYAALRCGKPGMDMYYALSSDDGKSWTPAKDIGFPGHAPYLYRLSDGTILLAHRLPHTALHVSRNEGKTWQGPYEIDSVTGAYPSIVERKDGTVLIVYYTEGKDSHIRVRRIKVEKDGIAFLPL